MSGSVIVGGARTPMGRLLGGLKDFSAAELGAHAIRAALARSGVDASAVDYVVMGQVIQAGAGQNPARQAAASAGIGMHVPSVTVNKVCLSSLEAIAYADFMIRCGEADVVVAGGMESMTRAPHLLLGSREGVKYGPWAMQDASAFDALTCSFDGDSMGAATERHSVNTGISRQEQDAFAARSHQRALAATEAGVFAEEIEPIVIPQRKGEPLVFARDEGVRPNTTAESLASLKPVFSSTGTITAGNASQISDGAAAVVVMSKERAEALGLSWIAEIVAHAFVAGPDTSLLLQPSNAINAALSKAGLGVGDLSLVEINEAFAVVGLASQRALGLPEDVVNVHGGAIAMGHPVGASGARIALHLALELQRRGGGLGAAALCGGGGQGNALLLRA